MQKNKNKRGNKKFGKMLDSLIFVVAITSPLALLPQVFQLFSTHSAGSLSLFTWIVLGSMNSIWFLYGVYHRESPIIISNSLVALLDFTIVIGILMYR